MPGGIFSVEQVPGRFEEGIDAGGIVAGTAGHGGFAASFAADVGGELLDECAGLKVGGEGFADADPEVGLASVLGDEDGDAFELALFEAVEELLEGRSAALDLGDDVRVGGFNQAADEGVSLRSEACGLELLESFAGGEYGVLEFEV